MILAFAVTASAATLNPFYPYQWTPAPCSGSTCTWTATDSSGNTITASSSNGWAPGGSGGTNFTPLLTNEFSVFGAGASLVITFPSSVFTGDELILGNIHDGYEYNLSATERLGVAINVNNWTYLGEDLNSTDPTSTCVGAIGVLTSPGGGSCAGTTSTEDFYVYDASNPGSNQGGVVAIGNLPSDVGTITLTLESNNVGNLFPTGGQGSDFIIANVGSGVPEPSSAVLIGSGVFVLIMLRRRWPCRLA